MRVCRPHTSWHAKQVPELSQPHSLAHPRERSLHVYLPT